MAHREAGQRTQTGLHQDPARPNKTKGPTRLAPAFSFCFAREPAACRNNLSPSPCRKAETDSSYSPIRMFPYGVGQPIQTRPVIRPRWFGLGQGYSDSTKVIRTLPGWFGQGHSDSAKVIRPRLFRLCQGDSAKVIRTLPGWFGQGDSDSARVIRPRWFGQTYSDSAILFGFGHGASYSDSALVIRPFWFGHGRLAEGTYCHFHAKPEDPCFLTWRHAPAVFIFFLVSRQKTHAFTDPFPSPCTTCARFQPMSFLPFAVLLHVIIQGLHAINWL